MSKHLGIAYNLRLPPELKEKISDSAKEHNRSMNADIVARLEQTFEKTNLENLASIPTELLMSALASRFNGLALTVSEIDKLPK